MFPSLDPKKMQAMMKQLGIAQEEISAEKVIIEKQDGKIIIENPSIVKIKMKGQESFQITGDVREVEESEEITNKTEEDIKILMDKTGCSENEARDALKKYGDLTEAILSLS